MDDIYYRLPLPDVRPYYHRLPSPPPPPQPLPHLFPNRNFDPYASVLTSPLPSHHHVRTLFVAGLPEDVKPREIYNLFRDFPGYQSSNLRTSDSRDSQPFAFVEFADQQSAVAAMRATNGRVFDQEKGSTLFIDLAKSNSRSKRSRKDDDATDSHKKFKGSSSKPRASINSGIGSHHIPGMSNSADKAALSDESKSNNDTGALKSAPQENPPCPTLFVANLGLHCEEKELIQVFSRCRGFTTLKVQRKRGNSLAFVDFEDTNCSTEALNQLQGTILDSSAGEGMRLEFAKSRMVKSPDQKRNPSKVSTEKSKPVLRKRCAIR